MLQASTESSLVLQIHRLTCTEAELRFGVSHARGRRRGSKGSAGSAAGASSAGGGSGRTNGRSRHGLWGEPVEESLMSIMTMRLSFV